MIMKRCEKQMTKCISCGSTQHRLYFKRRRDKYIHKEIKFFRCKKCGLVFLKPQPIKELRKLYKKEYRPKIGVLQTLIWLFPYSKHHKFHLTCIKHLLKPKGRVLDVGCGSGKFLYLLKIRGWDVLGVEPNYHYAKFANNVLKVPTINGFIEDVKLDGKFDLITMLDVLEHVSNPIKVLKKVKSLLKKGSRLYVVVPHMKKSSFWAPHLFMYTKNTITKLVESVGLVTESIKMKNNKIHLIARKCSRSRASHLCLIQLVI